MYIYIYIYIYLVYIYNLTLYISNRKRKVFAVIGQPGVCMHEQLTCSIMYDFNCFNAKGFGENKPRVSSSTALWRSTSCSRRMVVLYDRAARSPLSSPSIKVRRLAVFSCNGSSR